MAVLEHSCTCIPFIRDNTGVSSLELNKVDLFPPSVLHLIMF